MNNSRFTTFFKIATLIFYFFFGYVFVLICLLFFTLCQTRYSSTIVTNPSVHSHVDVVGGERCVSSHSNFNSQFSIKQRCKKTETGTATDNTCTSQVMRISIVNFTCFLFCSQLCCKYVLFSFFFDIYLKYFFFFFFFKKKKKF